MTINGKALPAGVTPATLTHMKGLLEGTLSGDRAKKGLLESHLTTGDSSIFSLAYLANTQVLPLFAEAPRVWNQIATTRAYPDFETPKLYTINPVVEGFARPLTEPGKPNNVPPIVPESSVYPHFTFEGELLIGGKLHKRGGKFSLSWEKIVSDAANILPQIPQLITRFFLDAEEWEVFGTLLASVGDDQQLAAGANVDGSTTVANAPLSREALAQAVTQLNQRTVDGRRVQVNGGYRLVVPYGQGDVARFYINNLTVSEINDTPLTIAVQGYNPLAGITVVESEYITGQAWYLLPAPGSTIRPVLELMKLQGHEEIDLRVDGATGTYVGGGTPGPYSGSFDTDDASLRGRYPLKGANWTPDLVVWSDGSGTA